MSKFKVGDKVYCPIVGTKVYTLTESCTSAAPLLLPVGDDVGTIRINVDGTMYSKEAAPSIFRATKENYELLSKLYPEVEFTKPPVPPTPAEVITKMLADGWAFVSCFVHNLKSRTTLGSCVALVSGVDDNGYFVVNGYTCYYAQPFDPRTGKLIVDYVNGEIVLGD